MSISVIRFLIILCPLIFILNGCSSETSDSGSGKSSNNSLFVLDAGHGVIAAFPSELPTTNTEFMGNVISSTRRFSYGIAYDSVEDELYVTAGDVFTSNSIEVFDQPGQRLGNTAPTRSIIPVIPQLHDLDDLLLDHENDRLYVLASRTYDGAIAVFNNVSQLNGSSSPSRLITGVNRGNFAIDFERNILYSKSDSISGGAIQAFPNVDTLNGELDKSSVRMILTSAPTDTSGMVVDSDTDRLYIAEEDSGVRILDNASTAGFIFGESDFIYLDMPLISLPHSTFYRSRLAYDSGNDRLFAGFGQTVYAVNNISDLNATNISTNALKVSAPEGSMISGFAFP